MNKNNLQINWLNQFIVVRELAINSLVGKHLPNNLYVHISALSELDQELQKYELFARQIADNIADFTLVKFNLEEPKISYLYYPDFEQNPHPILKKSVVINIQDQECKIISYENSNNPPILHRKETFIKLNDPNYQTFLNLTQIEEKLGLLDNIRYIGTQNNWQQLLTDHNLMFVNHNLVCPINSEEDLIKIERHKAALVRNKLSRPVQLALIAELFTEKTTFFDYGCGYGFDVKLMAEKGYQSSGWDPYYHPNNALQKADIVNIGYIINVIENLGERREALLKAWELTKDILIVSAQVLINDRQQDIISYGDGIVTQRNTFQKYYEQDELKTYIEQVLNTEAIPAGLGIYFVFRDENKAHNFRASRFHSRVKSPRILSPLKKFADYQDLLHPLINFYTERGRLPIKGEWDKEAEIKAEFGSFKRAFKVILQVTDENEWDKIADQRRQDILLYLALSRFGKRPTLRKLSPVLKADIKELFGNYQVACLLADEMLITLRNLRLIKQLCQSSNVGKVFNKSFLIHESALDSLPTLLRLYEGCASRTIGRMEEANLIRFYFNQPKICYLYVPEFDKKKQPILHSTMTVDLRDLKVYYHDFSQAENAPVIKDKHLLVLPEH